MKVCVFGIKNRDAFHFICCNPRQNTCNRSCSVAGTFVLSKCDALSTGMACPNSYGRRYWYSTTKLPTFLHSLDRASPSVLCFGILTFQKFKAAIRKGITTYGTDPMTSHLTWDHSLLVLLAGHSLRPCPLQSTLACITCRTQPANMFNRLTVALAHEHYG